MTDRPDLLAQVERIISAANEVDRWCLDLTDPDDLTRLLVAIREAKQAVSIAAESVEAAVVSVAPEKRWVSPVGEVEVLKRTRRTQWRNDDLWDDLVKFAPDLGVDPLQAVRDCARPSWRLEQVRGFGLDPDDYCKASDDGWSVKVAARKVEDRGEGF